MKYFDLHCDTATRTFFADTSLSSNDFHVSLDRLGNIEKYTQIMAVFSREDGADEECFEDFKKVIDYHKTNKDITQITSGNSLDDNSLSYVWAVEDARILGNDLSRIDYLYGCGVRIITPVWADETVIGGAFNTDKGLTEFGRNAVSRFLQLGIIPDISHSSEKTADEIFSLAEAVNMPVIASHSCAYSVRNHPRNLRDYQFERVKKSGGIVGLSFCIHHLTDTEKTTATMDDIMRHVEYYLSLGGENILCIGADFDGTDLPEGVDGIQNIPDLYKMIKDKYGITIADKIFYENAYGFFKKHLK